MRTVIIALSRQTPVRWLSSHRREQRYSILDLARGDQREWWDCDGDLHPSGEVEDRDGEFLGRVRGYLQKSPILEDGSTAISETEDKSRVVRITIRSYKVLFCPGRLRTRRGSVYPKSDKGI
jgi:hypothetical protein